MPETSVPAAHAGMTPHGGSLRAPGAILVVSCYELGHQPLGLAWPMAFLERAGYAPRALDLALEPLDEAVAGAARLPGPDACARPAMAVGPPQDTWRRAAVACTGASIAPPRRSMAAGSLRCRVPWSWRTSVAWSQPGRVTSRSAIPTSSTGRDTR